MRSHQANYHFLDCEEEKGVRRPQQTTNAQVQAVSKRKKSTEGRLEGSKRRQKSHVRDDDSDGSEDVDMTCDGECEEVDGDGGKSNADSAAGPSVQHNVTDAFKSRNWLPTTIFPAADGDQTTIGPQVVIKGVGFSIASESIYSRSSSSSAPNVQKNDVVVCIPTQAARNADNEVGYHLPFSLGRIVEVKGSGVVVTWLFSRSIDGVWNVWDQGVKGRPNLRRDELFWEEILRDSAGVVFVQFCRDKTLKKGSVARLKANPMLAMSEDIWRSFFRKK